MTLAPMACPLEHAVEIGPVGVEILRAVKDRLDPTGILNPGVLIP